MNRLSGASRLESAYGLEGTTGGLMWMSWMLVVSAGATYVFMDEPGLCDHKKPFQIV